MGIIGANGIVGGGIPLATGAAWSCKYREESRVVVCFFGEGATNTGTFHEGLNLASIWGLPVVFVCENNLYGFTTHFARTTLLRNIADRASAYGIPGIIADGMDVLDVYKKAGEMISRARGGKGASILECKTYRYRGHSLNERSTYREKTEIEQWKIRDPINRFKSYLVGNIKINPIEIERVKEEVDNQIEAAVDFAEKSEEADPMDFKKYIFA
jgi:TPP-dependent pyruvate/acetoin dehydrogenase alpha subunit